MKLFGSAILIGALSVPFIASGCSRENNTAITKQQEAIKNGRKNLEDSERKLAIYLSIRASRLASIGSNIELIRPHTEKEIPHEKAYFKLLFAEQDFKDNVGSKLISQKLTNEQIGYFVRLLETAETFAFFAKPYTDLSKEEFALSFEKGLKTTNLNYPKEEINTKRNTLIKALQKYNDVLSKVMNQRAQFIKDVESFNIDAEAAKQPLYEPRWDLTRDRLEKLKSIK